MSVAQRNPMTDDWFERSVAITQEHAPQPATAEHEPVHLTKPRHLPDEDGVIHETAETWHRFECSCDEYRTPWSLTETRVSGLYQREHGLAHGYVPWSERLGLVWGDQSGRDDSDLF